MIVKQILNILNRKEKLSIVYLLLLSFINIIVETLTIGSIIPLVTSILSFERIEENYYVKFVTNFFFEETNKQNFLILLAYFIIVLISIKTLAEILIVSFKSKIQNNLNVYFQKNLLKKFLNEDWKFHLKHDSSSLVRQITHEIGYIVGRLILPIIEIVIDIILILSFLILLIIYNLEIALIAFTLLVSSLFFLNFFSRRQVKKISNKRYFLSIFSFKSITEIFIILKEIIINSSANLRIEKYISYVKKYYTYERLINIYNILPKLFFEFFVILLVCIAIIIYSKSFQNYSSLLITLSLYMAAAIKMIPSATKIARNLQYVEIGKPAFLAQEQNLLEIKKGFFENKKKNVLKINDCIELKKISFSFNENQTSVLKEINLKLFKNKIICIKGESGSGKTTLAKIIMGIIKPSCGEIFLDNKKIKYHNDQFKLNIGYVDQISKLLDDTLKNNITLLDEMNIEQNKRYKDLIEKCGLEKLDKDIQSRTDKKIGEDSKFISGGEKQRISIARTLFRDPEIIIFDEPTSALDIENEEKIMNLINQFKKDKIIMVITHNMKFLSNFDDVYILKMEF